jgi:adenylate kinase
MGIAGSGKGTQGRKLADKYGLKYLSTGEMLREHATPELQQRLMTGKLLEDPQVIDMIKKVFSKLHNPDLVLLDGFPRSVVQAEWLYELVRKNGMSQPIVIRLEIPKEEARARLTLRGRSDDVPDTIEERFHEYNQATMPIVAYFQSKNFDMYEVDASKSPEIVYESILEGLKNHQGLKVNADSSKDQN